MKGHRMKNGYSWWDLYKLLFQLTCHAGGGGGGGGAESINEKNFFFPPYELNKVKYFVSGWSELFNMNRTV